ncbi:MAG: DUF6758 family protein [Candidatus Nanopelagicales bacterium]
MSDDPRCPRCGVELLAPTVMREYHACPTHGPVPVQHPPRLPSSATLTALAAESDVPFWVPWPLPATWVFAGIQVVGGGRQPIEAATLGFTGRGMSAGPSDLLIVGEKPGTGVGARWAGVPEPAPSLMAQPATTKIRTAGWPTPLWSLESPGRAAYVGESAGCWLWLITWPDTSWSVFDLDLELRDLRDGIAIDLPSGAMLPRLEAPDR